MPGMPSPTPAVVGRTPPRRRHRRGCGGGRAGRRRRRGSAACPRSPPSRRRPRGRTPACSRSAPAGRRGRAGQPTAVGVLAALPRGDQQLDARADEGTVACPADLVLQGRSGAGTLLHDLLGQLAVHVGAGLPGRLEYWKVKALENCAAATTSRVCWKSASVSPGKPTMMSVVSRASGMAARTRRRSPGSGPAGSPRRMRRRTSSEPDCSGMCSWWHTAASRPSRRRRRR